MHLLLRIRERKTRLVVWEHNHYFFRHLNSNIQKTMCLLTGHNIETVRFLKLCCRYPDVTMTGTDTGTLGFSGKCFANWVNKCMIITEILWRIPSKTSSLLTETSSFKEPRDSKFYEHFFTSIRIILGHFTFN